MRRSLKGLVLGASLLLSTSWLCGTASAAVISYTSEAAWQAAMTGGYTVNDFDALTLNSPGTVIGQPHLTLTTQIAGMSFSNAEVIPSCCSGGVHSSPNVVLNADLSGDIVIVFDALVQGIGLWNASFLDGETFEIFDNANTLLGSMVAPFGSVNFGGFVDSGVGIKKLVVTPGPNTNGSIFIDSLQVGSMNNPVPEPGTYALTAMALALLGNRVSRTKRRTKQ